MSEHEPAIPLRWVKNDLEGAEFAFGPGRESPALTYLGAPIEADFELSYDSLAPYVTRVLNLAADLEGVGRDVQRVEIKDGRVRVS